MKEVATFDWDKMFVFGYEVSVDEIERVAGVKITENQQFKRKIIFTKDQKLVYYEELPTDIEQAIPNEVFFGDAVGGPQVYAVDGAIFDANEIAVGNTVCYRLKVAGNNE